MERFDSKDIEEIPLGSPHFRRQVEIFLGSNGLRLEDVDRYFTIHAEDGEILAGGGISENVIKCIAVDERHRGDGLAAPLVSRLISAGAEAGYDNLMVYTKPSNCGIFKSFGFKEIASSPEAVLLENGRGLENYKRYLGSFRGDNAGVIVMNADPFTLGHLHLIEEALKQVDRLFVILVGENRGRFSASERLSMVRASVPEGVIVLEGSKYCISSATFPTYFLKDLSKAAETHMRLDLDLFARHISPALGNPVRFVGSEPTDNLTARYNALMKETLQNVTEIPRLCDLDGPVSASRVRKALDMGSFRKASSLVPEPVRKYLLSDLMERALRMELDAPLKPGLVTPSSHGAHKDMDYAMMLRSIEVIRRSFALASPGDDPVEIGKTIENEVLEATGGVNTHRGAIFCLGLEYFSALTGRPVAQIAGEIAPEEDTHGGKAVRTYGVKGALQIAQEGYADLEESWIPYYESLSGDPFRLQKTLLKIMSSLDDTCVIHRAGFERAREVRKEAEELLGHFSEQKLKEMTERYAEEGISPGGAADMLTLTIYKYSLEH